MAGYALLLTIVFAVIEVAVYFERVFIKKDMEKNPDYQADKDLRENVYKLIGVAAVYVGLLVLGCAYIEMIGM